MMALIADGWLRQQESVERARSEATTAEGTDTRGDGPLEGVWVAERYRLATGPEHPLDGRIFIDDGDWQVLFFVMGPEEEAESSAPEPRRGSGEGGRYEVRGDTVVFRHLFHLSAGDSVVGLPASALRMEVTAAAEAAREPTRFIVDGDRLTLFFPSGNEIDFVRR